jgi:Ion channel
MMRDPQNAGPAPSRGLRSLRSPRLVRRLFSWAPWHWGLAFVALIPVFGATYGELGPGSFYDANIQREPSLTADARHLSNAITDELDRPRADPLWRTKSGLLQLEPNTLKANSIRHTTDGRLLIDVQGAYRRARGLITSKRSFDEWLRVFTFDAPRDWGPARAGYGVQLSDVDGELSQPLGSDPPPALIVPPVPSRLAPPSGAATILLLTLPTFNRLTRFYKAAEGDPWYASDRWWRMTYLSEVTVTTLGFGDITPVTGAARAAVALEAMLGIVLIGLFLNSVAQRSRRRGDDD